MKYFIVGILIIGITSVTLYSLQEKTKPTQSIQPQSMQAQPQKQPALTANQPAQPAPSGLPQSFKLRLEDNVGSMVNATAEYVGKRATNGNDVKLDYVIIWACKNPYTIAGPNIADKGGVIELHCYPTVSEEIAPQQTKRIWALVVGDRQNIITFGNTFQSADNNYNLAFAPLSRGNGFITVTVNP